jgi:hypothetical protein
MENTKDWKFRSLEKFLLGQKITINKPENVFTRCVEIAYKNMMTSGRFYLKSDKETNY